MLLEGKNIVLTGAGKGIGAALAVKLASEGANICLVSRNESDLQSVLAEINSKFDTNSSYVLCDVSNPIMVSEAIKAINLIFNEDIHILINNAGIQNPIGEFIDNDIEDWAKNIETNLFSMVYLCKGIIPSMTKNKRGKIINFSGGGSTSVRPNFSAYSVAKIGIVKFTETLAHELAKYNIEVNAVSPGAINTQMLDEVLVSGEKAGKEFEAATLRKQKGGNDMKDILNLVTFLCSEDSNGISGKLISAPWDAWNTNEYQQSLRIDKDLATLRRIDNKTFFKK